MQASKQPRQQARNKQTKIKKEQDEKLKKTGTFLYCCLLYEFAERKPGWRFTARRRYSQIRDFFLEKSNTKGIVSFSQKEQRPLVKKHTLKLIMFEIIKLGARKFMNCC